MILVHACPKPESKPSTTASKRSNVKNGPFHGPDPHYGPEELFYSLGFWEGEEIDIHVFQNVLYSTCTMYIMCKYHTYR
jgi:hypothetical protein